jgi:hypothetical protein
MRMIEYKMVAEHGNGLYGEEEMRKAEQGMRKTE